MLHMARAPQGRGPASRKLRAMQTMAVIDFETTGMSPAGGARATEIAAALVCNGRIVGRYQSLMNSGAWVPPFIERLTGISNAMLAEAPPADQVMREVSAFVEGLPLVAHNAAFDRAFWRAELALATGVDEYAAAGCGADRFVCTLLLARRLYPEAPNHRLGTLAEWHDLPRVGRAHRAMADAEVTAHLLCRMQRDIERRYAAELGDRAIDHTLLRALQRSPRTRLATAFATTARRSKRTGQRAAAVRALAAVGTP
jgi:DNA polymerase-3 subunit epsilon